jgi:hypothetical protein
MTAVQAVALAGCLRRELGATVGLFHGVFLAGGARLLICRGAIAQMCAELRRCHNAV